MGAYVIRRILQAILTLVIVVMLVFLTVRLLPGDPLLMYVSQQNMRDVTAEQLTDLRHQFGLDKPLVVQFFDWVEPGRQGRPGGFHYIQVKGD